MHEVTSILLTIVLATAVVILVAASTAAIMPATIYRTDTGEIRSKIGSWDRFVLPAEEYMAVYVGVDTNGAVTYSQPINASH
jgi:hypothetical protein